MQSCDAPQAADELPEISRPMMGRQLVAYRGRTELWHSRLTTANTGTGPDRPSRIRALWSPDYRPEEKLDELIRALRDARPEFIGIEHLPDTEIEEIRASLEDEVGCGNGKAATADDSVERLLDRT